MNEHLEGGSESKIILVLFRFRFLKPIVFVIVNEETRIRYRMLGSIWPTNPSAWLLHWRVNIGNRETDGLCAGVDVLA